MDFIDSLRNFASRAVKVKDSATSEAATRSALVMPFFQMMEYDVFNPSEFINEFTADVGTKKGEKVDFAIIKDGDPTILIEVKPYGDDLDNPAYVNQLLRYYTVTTAKFGILTDGITYKFYTETRAINKMDLEPFLVFNTLDYSDHFVPELKRFTKSSFDLDGAYTAAVELKHAADIKQLFDTNRADPTENFIKYIMGEVFSGQRTQRAIEMFTPIVKRAFNQYITDNIQETLKNAMRSQTENASPIEKPRPADPAPEPAPTLTIEEIEAFKIVKSILRELCDVERLATRPAKSYISVLLDDNKLKRVCRFWFKGKRQLYITIPDETRTPIRYDISTLNDIYNYADRLKEACNRHLVRGEFEEHDEPEVGDDIDA